MSLQVWLPLNGEVKHQGLSKPTLTTRNITFENSGPLGRAAAFNGTDSYIQFPFNIQSGVSYCFWFKINTDKTCFILDARASNTGHQPFYCYASNQSNTFQTGGSNVYKTYNDSRFIINTWYHIVITYGNNEYKLYVNGELLKTFTYTNQNYNNALITLGARHNLASGVFGGISMCDFRFYNHVLSPREVKELSQGLIVHYLFNNFTDMTEMSNVAGYHKHNGNFVGTWTRNNSSARYIPANATSSSSTAVSYIPSPLLSNCEAFTVTCWIKPSTTATMCILNDRVVAGSGIGIFYLGQGIRFDTGSSTSASGQMDASTKKLTLNQWNFIACSWNKNTGTKKIYINSSTPQIITGRTYTSLATGTYSSVGNSSAGANITNGNQLNGSISDFRIYGTTLSDDDVDVLYKMKINS